MDMDLYRLNFKYFENLSKTNEFKYFFEIVKINNGNLNEKTWIYCNRRINII